ncbi:MAG: hypothetical protein VZQ75_01805 [Candidatus Faecousia sp.]|nr:hypothetical protein [Candidatus Faecousia sp.]
MFIIFDRNPGRLKMLNQYDDKSVLAELGDYQKDQLLTTRGVQTAAQERIEAVNVGRAETVVLSLLCLPQVTFCTQFLAAQHTAQLTSKVRRIISLF